MAALERQERNIEINEIGVDYRGVEKTLVCILTKTYKKILKVVGLKLNQFKITFLVVDKVLDSFLEFLQLKVVPFYVALFKLKRQLGYFFGSAVAI